MPNKPEGNPEDHEVTQVLRELRNRPELFNEKLLPLLYKEMRKMAGNHMRREGPEHTLQPTALVNEVYLQMARSQGVWENRAHFLASASKVMRHYLIDYARKKRAIKNGRDVERVVLDEVPAPKRLSPETLIAIDTALKRLQAIDPMQEEIIHLKFFAGLTIEEIAEVMGIGLTTVKKRNRLATAWLERELADWNRNGRKN